MDVKDVWRALAGHWVVIVTATVLGAGLGVLSALAVAPSYEATSVVMVSPNKPEKDRQLTEMATFVQTRMESWAGLTTSAAVLNPVRDRLKLADGVVAIAGRVQVLVPPGSSLIDVTVTGSSSADAARLADAIADSLAVQVVRNTPTQTGGAAAVTTKKVQSAQDAVTERRPSILARGILGMGAGFVLSLLLANFLLAGRRFGRGAAVPVRAVLPEA